jgi:hypothetical protein
MLATRAVLASVVLTRFLTVAKSSAPSSSIRNEFKRSFNGSQSFVDFAGGVDSADQLSKLLLRAQIADRAYDEARYLFVAHLSQSEKLSEDVCELYLAALSRCETCSWPELVSTIEVMKARGAAIDAASQLGSIALIALRHGVSTEGLLQEIGSRGGVDDFPVMLALHAAYFKTLGWSETLINFTLKLFALNSAKTRAKILNPAVIALVRDRGLPVEGAMELLAAVDAESAADVPTTDYVRLAADTRHTALSLEYLRKVKLPAAALEEVGIRLLATRQYTAAAEVLGELTVDLPRALSAMAPVTANSVDGLYSALEARRTGGLLVSRDLLKLVLAGCEAIGDGERAAQTVTAAANEFGLPLNAV